MHGPFWMVAARTQSFAEELITALCAELRLLRSAKDGRDTLPDARPGSGTSNVGAQDNALHGRALVDPLTARR